MPSLHQREMLLPLAMKKQPTTTDKSQTERFKVNFNIYTVDTPVYERRLLKRQNPKVA